MVVSTEKLDLALARAQMPISRLRQGTSPQTLRRIQRGENVRPATLGRIAQALGVDVTELIDTEVKTLHH